MLKVLRWAVGSSLHSFLLLLLQMADLPQQLLSQFTDFSLIRCNLRKVQHSSLSSCQFDWPNMCRFSSVMSSSVNGIDPGCEFSTVKWKLLSSAFECFFSFDHLFSEQSVVYLPLWTLSTLSLFFFNQSWWRQEDHLGFVASFFFLLVACSQQ